MERIENFFTIFLNRLFKAISVIYEVVIRFCEFVSKTIQSALIICRLWSVGFGLLWPFLFTLPGGVTLSIVPVPFTCYIMVFPLEGGQHSVTSRRTGVKLLHIYSIEVCIRTTFHRHRWKWSHGLGLHSPGRQGEKCLRPLRSSQ